MMIFSIVVLVYAVFASVKWREMREKYDKERKFSEGWYRKYQAEREARVDAEGTRDMAQEERKAMKKEIDQLLEERAAFQNELLAARKLLSEAREGWKTEAEARGAAEKAREEAQSDMREERKRLEHEKQVVTDMMRILDYTGGPTA